MDGLDSVCANLSLRADAFCNSFVSQGSKQVVTKLFPLLKRLEKKHDRIPIHLTDCHKISIYHGCMVWIEKSVTRVTDRHHEARVTDFSIHTIHP